MGVPLFWQSSYLETQSDTAFLAGISLSGDYLESREHTLFRTWIVFDASPNGLKSPCRATFGGFFSIDYAWFASDIKATIAGLAEQHRDKTLKIYLSPEHAELFKGQEQRALLQSCGFVEEFFDLDFSITTNKWNEASLSKGNRKKLRQWREAGGRVEKVDLCEINDIYEVIRVNRESIGVVPSISLGDLNKLINQFGDHYELFVGHVNGEVAVVAVTVDTHIDTKYVFFWADVLKHRNLSPVVAMCCGLVEICQSINISTLDLGIATEDGNPNEGLMRFKSNLGAESSEKYMLKFQRS